MILSKEGKQKLETVLAFFKYFQAVNVLAENFPDKYMLIVFSI